MIGSSNRVVDRSLLGQLRHLPGIYPVMRLFSQDNGSNTNGMQRHSDPAQPRHNLVSPLSLIYKRIMSS